MNFISSASGESRWRGYDYWEEKKVLSYECASGHEAEGIVKGSEIYHVKIDTEHPRKSTCDCPFAQENYTLGRTRFRCFLFQTPLKKLRECSNSPLNFFYLSKVIPRTGHLSIFRKFG